MRTEAPAVRALGATHRYRRTVALDGVDFDAAAGEMVGLLGPDGAGKSTLLGLIAGAKRLQGGRVETLGGDMGEAGWRRRATPRIAFMPQGLGRNLYADLSVVENLDFFGRLFGLGRAERAERGRALLEAVGLDPFVGRRAGKLSGGMKQKLGLCAALIHDPELIVLDEPTTGVDPLSRRQFWEIVSALRAERPELAVVVATGDAAEAAAFDRIVMMDRGRVLAEGTPAELTERAGAASLEAAYGALYAKGAAAAEPAPPPPRREGRPVAISASGLTKRFGDFTAVDAVSFDIAEGEIFGFLGSNGCGKSTTMKMLTGLLPATSGETRLFGRPLDARDREARRAIGYMTQSFSLYGELTARRNLELHARIFDLPRAEREARIAELSTRFGLTEALDQPAESLPLGLKQRLSLAVALIHAPRVLILDEPTSGVDPEARDAFWRLLTELSREQGVTIFVSTHFMAEALRCDRVSLMHAGRVLAVGSPEALTREAGAETLEEAFVAKMREAAPPAPRPRFATGVKHTPALGAERHPPLLSFGRLAAYARRETLELVRDPVRVAFAFLGSTILMTVLCFGVSLDIKDLRFTVLDLDRSPESRAWIAEFEGSRFFEATEPAATAAEARLALAEGRVALALETPPGFGRRLKSGEPVEALAVVDGAIPFKGEMVEGYVEGVHARWLGERAREERGAPAPLATVEPRYRYNPAFESITAMAPAMPALLLVLLPAILTAVSVARERELGSIANFYATPTSRLEFLVGKQAPYVAIAFGNFVLLAAMTVWFFGVALKGDPFALALGAFLYVWATTAFGLLMSALTRTQVAAVFATALVSLIPTMQFSGLLQPVSTLDGSARLIGSFWPASWFLHLNVGAFAKGLGWAELAPDLLALTLFAPVITLLAALALKKQER